MTSVPEVTVSVRMSNGAAGAGVARAVTQGMAARAGLAPLAAARAGNQVAGALNGGRAPVVLGLATEPGRLFVLFTAAGTSSTASRAVRRTRRR